MSETRLAYQTQTAAPPPTDAERVAPIAEWLVRHIAPLMAADKPVTVQLDIKGADVKARWTLSAKIV